jgi:hypothetical protein
MRQLDDDAKFYGKVIFRVAGGCALLLFFFWNPLMLPPRFWNPSAVARSMAIDTTLVLVGIGLIGLRRWAGLLGLALAGCIGFASLLSSTEAAQMWLSLVLLMPALILAVLIVVFWRTLAWGNRILDPLLALGGVVICALIHYIAFIVRRA